eukprot:scaffold6910_cov136-Isochrysis_galbana.AAC.10
MGLEDDDEQGAHIEGKGSVVARACVARAMDEWNALACSAIRESDLVGIRPSSCGAGAYAYALWAATRFGGGGSWVAGGNLNICALGAALASCRGSPARLIEVNGMAKCAADEDIVSCRVASCGAPFSRPMRIDSRLSKGAGSMSWLAP